MLKKCSALNRADVGCRRTGQRGQAGYPKRIGSALRVQRLSTSAITTLVGLSLITSVLIVWLYVGRNIVARLTRLNSAMFDIAAGGRLTPVPVDGNDEVAAMGRAVETFRRNAIALDELLRSVPRLPRGSRTWLRSERVLCSSARRSCGSLSTT